mgnify:FL=1
MCILNDHQVHVYIKGYVYIKSTLYLPHVDHTIFVSDVFDTNGNHLKWTCLTQMEII